MSTRAYPDCALFGFRRALQHFLGFTESFDYVIGRFPEAKKILDELQNRAVSFRRVTYERLGMNLRQYAVLLKALQLDELVQVHQDRDWNKGLIQPNTLHLVINERGEVVQSHVGSKQRRFKPFALDAFPSEN